MLFLLLQKISQIFYFITKLPNHHIAFRMSIDNFHSIGSTLKGAEAGQLFGKPCYKINGKAFICFFQDEMVFKLEVEDHKKTLALSGSQLFDPSGKKRPMKEWVQVPAKHKAKWEGLAKEAMRYVKIRS